MSPARLRTVEEHLAEVLTSAHLTRTEDLPLADALGRTLRTPVTARMDLPAFDNSSMDGFAVRYVDVATAPATLRVVADMPAGSGEDPPLRRGEAARIMTGAAVPSDADTIVPFEDTAGGLADSLGEIRITTPPRAHGAFIRRRGGDARLGDEVLPPGIVLGPRQAAAAAAAGAARVHVSQRPRVAIVSTGSELVGPGESAHRGQIPDSNGILLAALVLDADAEVIARHTVPDDDDALRAVVNSAIETGADVIVFSGGVSAGAYEVVRSTLGDGRMGFHSVAMQPGKPQGFGALPGGPLLFGLPGNPVSSAVSFEVFVRPALLAMQGRSDLHRPRGRMPVARGWRTPPGRRQYLPVAIDRTDPVRHVAVPATSGMSHLAAGLARAEAYAVVPADIDEVAEGDLVDVMLVT